jgi:hypothetical protein
MKDASYQSLIRNLGLGVCFFLFYLLEIIGAYVRVLSALLIFKIIFLGKKKWLQKKYFMP